MTPFLLACEVFVLTLVAWAVGFFITQTIEVLTQ